MNITRIWIQRRRKKTFPIYFRFVIKNNDGFRFRTQVVEPRVLTKPDVTIVTAPSFLTKILGSSDTFFIRTYWSEELISLIVAYHEITAAAVRDDVVIRSFIFCTFRWTVEMLRFAPWTRLLNTSVRRRVRRNRWKRERRGFFNGVNDVRTTFRKIKTRRKSLLNVERHTNTNVVSNFPAGPTTAF